MPASCKPRHVPAAEQSDPHYGDIYMEGLAITPDGKILVAILHANLEQDNRGSLRIVPIDIAGGATHEYAFQLTEVQE